MILSGGSLVEEELSPLMRYYIIKTDQQSHCASELPMQGLFIVVVFNLNHPVKLPQGMLRQI